MPADTCHAIRFFRKLGFRDAARTPRAAVRARRSFVPAAAVTRVRRRFLRHGVCAPAAAPRASRSSPPARRSRRARRRYATDAARTGWNARWSGYIARFEREFAEYVGAKHAIATSSCTGALHLALLRSASAPATR